MRRNAQVMKTIAVLFLLSLFFILIHMPASAGASESISSDMQEYLLGEPVMLMLESSPDLELRIQSPSGILRYSLPLQEEIAYQPEECGAYRAYLVEKQSGQETGTVSFNVLCASVNETNQSGDPEMSRQPTNTSHNTTHTNMTSLLARTRYLLGEQVIIDLSNIGEDIGVYINAGEDTYKLIMSERKTAAFIPPREGIYELEILLPSSEQLSVQEFYVGDVDDFVRLEYDQVRVVDKQGQDLFVAGTVLRPRDETGAFTEYAAEQFELELKSMPFDVVHFQGLVIKPSTLRVENLVLDRVQGFKVAKSFAIDPTGLEFTSATIPLTAEGAYLYKCKAWNYTNSTCDGIWELDQELIPGKGYEIRLGPHDPGYAEVYPQVCQAEDSDAQGSWTSDCLGNYPDTCGPAGDLLTCDDGNSESHSF